MFTQHSVKGFIQLLAINIYIYILRSDSIFHDLGQFLDLGFCWHVNVFVPNADKHPSQDSGVRLQKKKTDVRTVHNMFNAASTTDHSHLCGLINMLAYIVIHWISGHFIRIAQTSKQGFPPSVHSFLCFRLSWPIMVQGKVEHGSQWSLPQQEKTTRFRAVISIK